MIDELRQFLLVVEHGTVTEAARHAHLSQPALSAALVRLETYFGARLLSRGRHGATPTAAGDALIPRARAVLAALADARRAVAEIEGLVAGQVRLAAGGTAATYLLPPLLARFRRRHPELRIVLRELTPSQADRELEQGGVDLAVVTGRAGELWTRDDSSGWPTPAPRRRGTGTDLSSRHHYARDSRSPFPGLQHRDGAVQHRGGKAARARWIGIALISRAAVESELSREALVELHHRATPIPRDFVLLTRGVELLSPAAAALRQLLLAEAPSPRRRSRGAGSSEAASPRRRGKRAC